MICGGTLEEIDVHVHTENMIAQVKTLERSF